MLIVSYFAETNGKTFSTSGQSWFSVGFIAIARRVYLWQLQNNWSVMYRRVSSKERADSEEIGASAYKERPRVLGLCSLEKRRLWGISSVSVNT